MCWLLFRPQTAKKFQAFPASLWPLYFQQLLFFSFPLFSLWFLALSCFPFFSSTKGSPWQGAGEGERKWVSGSAPATGPGWLLSLWNWSPARSAEHPSTLQPISVLYFSQFFFFSAVFFNILSCFHFSFIHWPCFNRSAVSSEGRHFPEVTILLAWFLTLSVCLSLLLPHLDVSEGMIRHSCSYCCGITRAQRTCVSHVLNQQFGLANLTLIELGWVRFHSWELR